MLYIGISAIIPSFAAPTSFSSFESDITSNGGKVSESESVSDDGTTSVSVEVDGTISVSVEVDGSTGNVPHGENGNNAPSVNSIIGDLRQRYVRCIIRRISLRPSVFSQIRSCVRFRTGPSSVFRLA